MTPMSWNYWCSYGKYFKWNSVLWLLRKLGYSRAPTAIFVQNYSQASLKKIGNVLLVYSWDGFKTDLPLSTESRHRNLELWLEKIITAFNRRITKINCLHMRQTHQMDEEYDEAESWVLSQI